MGLNMILEDKLNKINRTGEHILIEGNCKLVLLVSNIDSLKSAIPKILGVVDRYNNTQQSRLYMFNGQTVTVKGAN